MGSGMLPIGADGWDVQRVPYAQKHEYARCDLPSLGLSRSTSSRPARSFVTLVSARVNLVRIGMPGTMRRRAGLHLRRPMQSASWIASSLAAHHSGPVLRYC